MLKRLYAIFLALITIFILCSCSGSISTFTVSVEKIPANFDPQIATDSQDLQIINNIFDGLFEYRDGKIVPCVASGYDVTDNGKTYIIYLKDDSVFHTKAKSDFDGTGVVAQDFVFAIQRVCSPSTHSPYADMFSNIKNADVVKNGGDVSLLGVYAKDDYTLVIELENADFDFIKNLCSSAVYPCNEAFFNTCSGRYGLSSETILSNGPFRLNYIDDDGDATLLRVNEEKGSLDRIRITVVSADNQKNAYYDGQISGYFTYSADDVTSSDAVFETDHGIISLSFNLSNKMLSNVSIRQALSWYAYRFINSGANLNAVPSQYDIFPYSLTMSEEYTKVLKDGTMPQYMSYDAKQVFRDALKSAGLQSVGSLSLLIPQDSEYKIIYENINQLWQKNLGTFFTIEYLPTSEISQRVKSGDYDIAFYTYEAESDSVYSILDKYTAYNSTLSDVVAKAKTYSDQQYALNDIKTAQNIILDYCYIVPMSRRTVYYCYDSGVKGLYIDPFSSTICLKYAKSK